ncbi:MSMEG_4193 family putative phosphomutase [Jiangella rhizosphaerae]|uniref:MSMEG_4193 family putative phosphomutase n=1 Tax=Jiangella rhizosphaerae TaxID=2293569 RepID=A0A418KNK2_9ACTN|nr:MSMEG_4193 family putative phosphomutase [Jiangella rhizosphaerae]RIQ20620.1 MSMEG_4193 family putative phosphomutase [Jiangella rhizosphaerae]
MPTVVLVRHGRTTANVAGVLAGRTPGVGLDDIGRDGAAALARRLAPVSPAVVVSSPLERCVQTATAIADGREVVTDDGLAECDYGDWTGRPLSELRREKLWKVVQEHPSGVVFPGGESLRGVQQRAVDAVRTRDAELAERHGPGAVWFAVSHADVIKAVLADALGLHLDHFQRLVVDPCSVSVVSFTERRPFVLRVNDVGGDLGFLKSPARRRRRATRTDAVVGGGAGDAAQ